MEFIFRINFKKYTRNRFLEKLCVCVCFVYDIVHFEQTDTCPLFWSPWCSALSLAPTTVETFEPPKKNTKVGIAQICIFGGLNFSTSTVTNTTSLYRLAIAAKIGFIAWQGGHHSAKQSTKINRPSRSATAKISLYSSLVETFKTSPRVNGDDMMITVLLLLFVKIFDRIFLSFLISSW